MLILASNSPRRRELIKKITDDYTVVIPKTEEIGESKNLTPTQLALYNAELKAAGVYARTGGTVIGADTIVVYGGKVIGKPKDYGDAVNTLKTLRGNTHSVITGVCVIGVKGKFSGACTSYVTMNSVSDAYIEDYVKNGGVMDKAGSYGLQDRDDLIGHLEGDKDNVIGFPVQLVKELLIKSGYDI